MPPDAQPEKPFAQRILWAAFDSSGNLRSGLRFLLFVVGFVIAGVVFGGAAIALLSTISMQAAPDTPAFLVVNGLVLLAVALTVGWLCGKYLEQLPFRSLGAAFTRNWAVNLLIGFFFGVATFALAAAVGTLFGGLSFSFNSESDSAAIASTLVISFLIFAAAAAFEESFFRGYILQTFARSGLTLFAAFFTAALFATVHNANPGATFLSWLNTFLAGIWLAAAYFKTRDLWLPFGLHLAWNWTQGSIFGVEVSGLTDIVTAPLMREIDTGPAWITGGDYGIEGGVVTTIALLVSTSAIYFLPNKPEPTA